MVVRLKVNLKDLPDIVFCSKNEFTKLSVDQLVKNFAALLNDQCSADIKIRTKDDQEFFAHKAILRGITITFIINRIF